MAHYDMLTSQPKTREQAISYFLLRFLREPDEVWFDGEFWWLGAISGEELSRYKRRKGRQMVLRSG